MAKDYFAQRVFIKDENVINPLCDHCGKEFSIFEFDDHVFELLKKSAPDLIVPRHISGGKNYVYICMDEVKPRLIVNNI